MPLSTIISFLSLSYALLALANAPTRGYELSIYSATPIIFWIAIIYGLLNGLLLITLDLYRKTAKMWMVGLFQILFCNCSVISLHALRGYVFYSGRGDVSSYVGLAKDIIEFGNFGLNFYPITSILISQLNQLSGLSTITISKYLPQIFFIFYFLSIYCLSKSLILHRKFVLCSMIACTPIFFASFSISIFHQILSVFTLPFFFYLLQRNSDHRFKFLSILFLIIYPSFHPIPGILVILYLSVFFISEKLNLGGKIKNVSISLLLLSVVSLVAWFTQQYFLLRSTKSILLQLVGLFKTQSSSDLAIFYLNSFGIINAIRAISSLISDEIIYSLISVVVIYRVLSRKEVPILQKFYKISLCFIIGNLFLLTLFFFSRTHIPSRLINLNFNILLTPPLVGYLLYNFSINNKKIQAILISSLIIFSSVIAIFSLYPSPMTIRPNGQVTIMDIKGMSWLLNQKKLEIKTTDVVTPIYRFSDLIYGNAFKIQRPDLHRDRSSWDIPDHFGFNDDNLLPIDEDRYLIITEFDIRAFTEVWNEIDRFSKEDFIKVNFCTNVDKIYENGEFHSYLVYKDV